MLLFSNFSFWPSLPSDCLCFFFLPRTYFMYCIPVYSLYCFFLFFFFFFLSFFLLALNFAMIFYSISFSFFFWFLLTLVLVLIRASNLRSGSLVPRVDFFHFALNVSLTPPLLTPPHPPPHLRATPPTADCACISGLLRSPCISLCRAFQLLLLLLVLS